MSGPALRNGARRVILLLSVFPLMVSAVNAKRSKRVEFRAQVVAVESPDEFDVAGYHVVMDLGTSLSSFYRSKRDDAQLRKAIAVGTVVDVSGTTDAAGHLVAAEHVIVHDAEDLNDQRVWGFGAIDKVLTAGTEPVFRADGYVMRVNSQTRVNFSGEISALNQVGTNIWVRYVGLRDDKNEIARTWAEFGKPKMKPRKPDPKGLLAQVTTFPPGSIIDFDGSFRTDGNDRNKHKIVDEGGACGWYPVWPEAALQQRVQRIGFSVIPQYQRDLPADDPAKVPFRFYVVEQQDIHLELGCGKDGLVLVSVDAVERLENDDQLAALLADEVAGQLLTHGERVIMDTDWAGIGVVFGVSGMVTAGVIGHEMQRKILEQRGRMALGYMADAGYDPWQAPETWRLLGPADRPKNLAKLKYPARSKYELGILELEYPRPGKAASTPGSEGGDG